MPSFSIPLTGLQADSTALNTIGNNLSNLNTTAFKKQNTSFEDLFYQQIGNNGSGEQLQTGAGVRVAGTASDFAQGSLSTTSNSTDMALNGDGFFVVHNGAVESLTRSGNFQLDKTGNLIDSNGENVMGFLAAADGTINSTGNLQPLSLPLGGNTVAKATSTFSIDGNLDATAPAGGSFNTSVNVFDSLGKSHTLSMSFTKAASPANTWAYTATLPTGDATGTPVDATGTLTFSNAGVLTSSIPTTSPVTTSSVNPIPISFSTLADGAATLTMNWQLNNATGTPTIAQSASPSTATASYQDGYASGTYESFQVDSTGVITAKYSNGKTAALGQLAIATVADPQGLTRVGGNNYQTSAASGEASFAGAGVGSRGTINDDALEQSNVDISTEFAELITAQRAFEANSKTVTTFDSVTQQAIAMIR